MAGYLSAQNFQQLLSIYEEYLQERRQSAPPGLKKMLFEVMESVSQGSGSDVGIKELNKQTLRALQGRLSAAAAAGAPSGSIVGDRPTDSLSRDQALYGTRPLSTDHLLPRMDPPRTSEHKQVIEERFKTLQSERGPAVVAPAAPVIEAFTDRALAPEEFQAKIEAMRQQRTVAPAPGAGAGAGLAAGAGAGLAAGAVAETMMGGSSVGESRLQMDRDARQGRDGPDPAEFFRTITAKATEEKKAETAPADTIEPYLPVLQTKTATPADTFIIPPPVANDIRVHRVLIQSGDRDWINPTQRRRYQYKVKFHTTSKSTREIPIYENNPTVPYTSTLTSPGVPNTYGWYDAANVFRQAYDPQAPQGAVLGYETLTLAIDTDANVQTNFKNIHSVEITDVILPLNIVAPVNAGTDPTKIKTLYTYDYNFNYPYILLRIDEFADQYEGTNDTVRRSFCKLVFWKTYRHENGRGYVVLRPVYPEKKVFSPTPLSVMPSLTLSLLKPNGDLVNKSTDGFMIHKLECDAGPAYIKIVLNRFFEMNEFYVGDTIRIREYTMFKLNTLQNQDAIQELNAFMNRDEGHVIISMDTANAQNLYRAFYIYAPGSIDEVLGIYDYPERYRQQIAYFNQEIPSGSLEFLQENTGYVMNLSLQNTITMKVEQRVYDRRGLAAENV